MPALTGVRVLDLSQFEAGPQCTTALAWLGADVVKIEPPVVGEQGRFASREDLAAESGQDSFVFLLNSSNKRSICLDLRDEHDHEVMMRLVENGDVIVENFAPGTMDRLGLSYEAVSERNPKIIYGTLKGYAPDSPFANHLSFDAIGQGAGGAVSLTGDADGPPMRPGPTIADTGSGLHLAIGILGALYQRQVTGKGQKVFVSMQEAVINFCRVAYAAQQMKGDNEASGRHGAALALPSGPSGIFPCAPGGSNDYVLIYTSRGKNGNRHWKKLLEIIGREDEDVFATPELRFEHREQVDAILSSWTKARTKHEVMNILGEAGVPVTAAFDTYELSHDEYLRSTGMFVELDHPNRGKYFVPGWPVRMTDSAVQIERAPLLDEHAQQVLTEWLQLDPSEAVGLRERGRSRA